MNSRHSFLTILAGFVLLVTVFANAQLQTVAESTSGDVIEELREIAYGGTDLGVYTALALGSKDCADMLYDQAPALHKETKATVDAEYTHSDCHVEKLVRTGERCTYTGTMEEFHVDEWGTGSFLGTLAGLRIQQDNETVDGLSFDLLASHIDEGVWRMDRLAGSVVAPLVEPYERFSTFRDAVVHGVQTYTAGKAIDSLTLPDTSECNGPLANGRLHDVPSISFDASKPGLNLSSPTSDTNNKSYPVVVEGADSNTLQFAIAGGEAQDKERAKVGLVADFDLDLENDEPEGIAYGDGRVYVVDAGDARVYSYTA
ncbi:MAG: hypothetical protein OXC80_03650, partial [Gammaproteobacteria bacterium]|nr:hypothetical protein [Gammaproteobacteria bacterium]